MAVADGQAGLAALVGPAEPVEVAEPAVPVGLAGAAAGEVAGAGVDVAVDVDAAVAEHSVTATAETAADSESGYRSASPDGSWTGDSATVTDMPRAGSAAAASGVAGQVVDGAPAPGERSAEEVALRHFGRCQCWVRGSG